MFVPLQLLYEITVWIAWYWDRPGKKTRGAGICKTRFTNDADFGVGSKFNNLKTYAKRNSLFSRLARSLRCSLPVAPGRNKNWVAA